MHQAPGRRVHGGHAELGPADLPDLQVPGGVEPKPALLARVHVVRPPGHRVQRALPGLRGGRAHVLHAEVEPRVVAVKLVAEPGHDPAHRLERARLRLVAREEPWGHPGRLATRPSPPADGDQVKRIPTVVEVVLLELVPRRGPRDASGLVRRVEALAHEALAAALHSGFQPLGHPCAVAPRLHTRSEGLQGDGRGDGHVRASESGL
mmetsp:Transcript_25406/g.85178  ORF Transcript_25406/g.85178 Transcript_25406/m.85178 type:complete len:207 (-) Transcript_25406:543-1163(-)